MVLVVNGSIYPVPATPDNDDDEDDEDEDEIIDEDRAVEYDLNDGKCEVAIFDPEASTIVDDKPISASILAMIKPIASKQAVPRLRFLDDLHAPVPVRCRQALTEVVVHPGRPSRLPRVRKLYRSSCQPKNR
ncbi:hypothetical protein LTR22_002732 [Elasticomyces elasticus]|nr:hypothetical protein LTR22_002732 [Elasticomyces elasticus]KAK4931246.1 hypothetical protein LTR49_002304 [Elasticomyces elasticus]